MTKRPSCAARDFGRGAAHAGQRRRRSRGGAPADRDLRLDKLIAKHNGEAVTTPENGDAAGAGGAAARERTIAEVMDWTCRRIATLAGVCMEAVRLHCKIET